MIKRNNVSGASTAAALATAVIVMTGVFFTVSPAVADGLTLEQLAALRYVDEIAVSPDGEMFAYTLTVQRNPFEEKNGSAWKELHVVSTNGGSRPFVTGKVRISHIAFTPDGKSISYLAERGDDTVSVLYLIAVDGGESVKISQNRTDIDEYSWAPDSHRLAFLAEDTLPTTTLALEKKGFNQEVYEEDGRDAAVWITDVSDSAAPRRLDLPGSASNIRWSPDGKYLALALAPTPLIDDEYMAREVCFVDVAEGTISRRLNNPGKLGKIAWSPDATRLAIISGADINDPDEGELLVASVDNDDLKPVITNFDGHVRDIAWLDQKTILYRSDEGVHTKIGMVDVATLERKEIIPPGSTAFTDMILSADRRTVAVVGSAYNHPWELFHFTLKQKEPIRLTDSNPWLSEVAFARQEVVEFTARDGLQLQGILIHPLNEQPGNKYPLILSVHGGPEANDRDEWLTWYASPAQVFAARGFAVFHPNYRGSTGRGVEFSKMGQADYAGGEFNDLVDAVDYLVATGLIDSSKVGITGRSYGGFATAWAATALSEHFAAAVMGVGVSDLVSKFGTTDIPNEMYLVHARRWPWDYWQWYMERSPIYHAQKHKTPILIMHGEDDTRVHPSQSMELYRYLKTLNQAPVRLVFYKDEGHGTLKAAARYDTGARVLRWMEHYLMGPGGDPPPYQIDYGLLEKTASSSTATER
ncbi:MAG: S9 family peptidase [Candidatus Zixiibacteriota bacterium]